MANLCPIRAAALCHVALLGVRILAEESDTEPERRARLLEFAEATLVGVREEIAAAQAEESPDFQSWAADDGRPL